METLTFIDVNSGKNVSKTDEAILNINKEAAIEIGKQLRLRNISGMIIIDFINMSTEEKKMELLKFFKVETSGDPIPTQVLDITKLGLVEVTRKKVNKSLLETIKM